MITIEWRGVDAWLSGAKRFPSDFARELVDNWQPVTEDFFDLTQDRVHVISGELKASGHVLATTRTSTDTVDTGLRYESDHGFWEMLRGGEHDFITEPFTVVEEDYHRAIYRAFEDVMDGWN